MAISPYGVKPLVNRVPPQMPTIGRSPLSPQAPPRDTRPSVPFTQPISAGPQMPQAPGQTPFGPGNDLRSTQIGPATSPRLVGAQGMAGQAASGVSGFNRGASFGGYASNLAGQLGGRGQIARDRLAAFDAEAQPALQNQIRSVGQQAAKFGRLGSGMTAIETLRPFTDLQARRSALSHQLAADTAEGEIGDKRSALEMAMGLSDRESSDAFGKLGSLGDYERGIWGQEGMERDELRGERGYQEGLARYAGDRSVQQREMENEEMNDRFRRGLGRSSIGLAGAGQTGQGAEGAYDLLMDWFRRRQAQQPPQAPAPQAPSRPVWD